MHPKLKKILVAFLCVSLSFCLYLYISMVVTPKDINDSGGALYYNGMGFLAEPKNSLNVMVYGNSDVYSGFTPAVFYEDCGSTSYASGKARQNMRSINDLLRKTLKTQTPKLILLETDCFFEEEEKKQNTTNIFSAPFVYHARWKEIKKRDFYTKPNLTQSVDINKGYINSDRIYETKLPEDYMGNPQSPAAALSPKTVEEVKIFLNTCREQGIRVLLVELPSPSTWTYARHNAVQKLAEAQGISFLDLNVNRAAYGLDLRADFRDNGDHLNRTGAKKATLYISAYLKANYADCLAESQSSPDWQQVVDRYRQNETV